MAEYSDYEVDEGEGAEELFFAWSEQECVRRGWVYPDFLEVADILITKEKRRMHSTTLARTFLVLKKPVRYRAARTSVILDSYIWKITYLVVSANPSCVETTTLYENDLLDYEIWRNGILVWSQQTMIDLEELQKAIWENRLDE